MKLLIVKQIKLNYDVYYVQNKMKGIIVDVLCMT